VSQSKFSDTYNIPLPTLKAWEQRRRHPDATAAAYIRTIALFPKETRRAQTAEIKAITKQRKPRQARLAFKQSNRHGVRRYAKKAFSVALISAAIANPQTSPPPTRS
jgi:hypothetical protein